MPELTGVEVCRCVRKMETDQPPYIIMLTSKDQKADIIAGLEAGADDYLVKPYDSGELRARLSVGARMVDMRESLVAARNALAHAATHDPLTGALNRRAISEALVKELSRSQRLRDRLTVGLSVGICDIDHFKAINDSMGHLAGDEVLCEVVRLLGSAVREFDHVGRMGGEEFIVIASGIEADEQESFYDRLRSVVAHNTISTKSGDVQVTISIGAVAVREGDNMEDLLAAADSALYRAKREGRNRVSITERKEP